MGEHSKIVVEHFPVVHHSGSANQGDQVFVGVLDLFPSFHGTLTVPALRATTPVGEMPPR